MDYWQNTVISKTGSDIFLKAVAYNTTVDVYGLYPGSKAGAEVALSAAGLDNRTNGFMYEWKNVTEMSWLDAIQELACKF